MTEIAINRIRYKAALILWDLSYAQRENVIYPLVWYIASARIDAENLRKIRDASERQLNTMIKRLAKGGTVEESVNRVMQYLDGIA